MEVLYPLGDATYRVRGALIDPHAWRVLAVKPQLGRDMTDADGAREAPPTFVMSDRMWTERFHDDPNVIGMTLKLNGTVRTLIAIAPRRFLLHNADVFFPTTITPDVTNALVGGDGKFPLSVWTYGRLKDGVTFEQAAGDLASIARREQQLWPQNYPRGDLKMTVLSLADAYTDPTLKEMVYILAGTVMMLLLIACSNVANLLLARATARETELALRESLGASRSQLVRQLLIESLVLAILGTFGGGLVAFLGLQWTRATIPAAALPAEFELRFSGEVLTATMAVTCVVALVAGIIPALHSTRAGLQHRLVGSGKGVATRTGLGTTQTVLVAIQFALAIVLLVAASMMIRTFISLGRIDLGLNPRNVLVGGFSFPVNQLPPPTEYHQFLNRVLEAVRVVPGVAAVSPTVALPLEPGAQGPVVVPGAKVNRSVSAIEYVDADYFKVLGIPLLRGRLLSPADIAGGRQMAVVNRHFARQFFEDGEAVGRVINFPAMASVFPNQLPQFEIVGLVGDTRNTGLESDIRPQVFVPYTVPGYSATRLLIRTNVDPLSIQQLVRKALWSVNQEVALSNVMTLEEQLNRDALAAPRFGVGLLSVFAGLGLVLAAIGIYSVMAYVVSLDTHTIGIRMALGAPSSSVMRMMLTKGMRPILAGTVIGLVGSYALRRVMEHQIHGITVNDPWTFVGVAVVLALVGILACLIPARRATRIDPLSAVRSE
jgi:putative ABC transport system permease protein